MSAKPDFPTWLLSQLHAQGWSQSELARRAELSPQAISDYINGKRTNYDQDALNGIARALKLPPEEVFRAAGYLPPASAESEILEQIVHVTSPLPLDEQVGILEFARMRARLAEEKGRYGVGEKAKRRSSVSGSD